MNKNDFYEFLNELKTSKGFSRKCCRALSSLARMIKKLDNDTFLQFMEVIAVYIETVDESNIANNENSLNSDNFLQEISELAQKCGIDMDVLRVDPVTGAKEYIEPQQYYQPQYKKDDNIKFIERRSLLVNITSTSFTINDSFMTYLEEIRDVNGANYYNPFLDESDEDENLGLTIGVQKDGDNSNIVITIFGGVNRYETFNFTRQGNIGIMDRYDFNYFKSITGNKLIGSYLFKLDDDRRSFIGKRITPIKINDNKGDNFNG